jgi:hypothetical protein
MLFFVGHSVDCCWPTLIWVVQPVNTGLSCCSMANYSKWDKFDPDLVCKEIDVQQSIDSSKKAKKKAFTEAASANELAVAAAKVAAESLQSQVRMSRTHVVWHSTHTLRGPHNLFSQADVEALKLKGAGGRRKREKVSYVQFQLIASIITPCCL